VNDLLEYENSIEKRGQPSLPFHRWIGGVNFSKKIKGRRVRRIKANFSIKKCHLFQRKSKKMGDHGVF
jgi:hypothetical protein